MTAHTANVNVSKLAQFAENYVEVKYPVCWCEEYSEKCGQKSRRVIAVYVYGSRLEFATVAAVEAWFYGAGFNLGCTELVHDRF